MTYEAHVCGMRPSDFVGVSDFVGTDVRCIAVDSAVGRDACARARAACRDACAACHDACAACAVIARSGVESAACTRDESGPRTSDPVRSGRAGRGHAVMTHDCHCAMHCVACRTATARQRVFNHKVRRTAPRVQPGRLPAAGAAPRAGRPNANGQPVPAMMKPGTCAGAAPRARVGPI